MKIYIGENIQNKQILSGINKNIAKLLNAFPQITLFDFLFSPCAYSLRTIATNTNIASKINEINITIKNVRFATGDIIK